MLLPDADSAKAREVRFGLPVELQYRVEALPDSDVAAEVGRVSIVPGHRATSVTGGPSGATYDGSCRLRVSHRLGASLTETDHLNVASLTLDALRRQGRTAPALSLRMASDPDDRPTRPFYSEEERACAEGRHGRPQAAARRPLQGRDPHDILRSAGLRSVLQGMHAARAGVARRLRGIPFRPALPVRTTARMRRGACRRLRAAVRSVMPMLGCIRIRASVQGQRLHGMRAVRCSAPFWSGHHRCGAQAASRNSNERGVGPLSHPASDCKACGKPIKKGSRRCGTRIDAASPPRRPSYPGSQSSPPRSTRPHEA